MRVLSTVKFTWLRMLRNYIVLLLLLVVPIILITVFSLILSDGLTETGEPYIHVQAMTMVLTFQLFGGSVVMYFIHHDFFTANRFRTYLLPFNRIMYAFSMIMCGTLFSILLGVIIMAFSQFVLGVEWANWLWSIFIITLMASLSSIVCLVFAFSVKNYKVAERLSEVYGVGFIVLAGLFFPMPKNAVFDFLGSYGNPLTLSIMSIQEMSGSNAGAAWSYAGILLAAIGILFMVLIVLGRRRMP